MTKKITQESNIASSNPNAVILIIFSMYLSNANKFYKKVKRFVVNCFSHQPIFWF